jgi:RimJ/RimL family protein N-acetyltransferase
MIVGDKIILTAVEKEDLVQLKYWRNNENYRKYFREYRELNSEMQMNWFEKYVLNDKSTIMFSIRRREDDVLLGCCGLCYINWIYRYADLSLYIGAEDLYIDNVGYAEESCKLIFEYAFNKLNLNKVWTEIYEFDYKKNNLYKKIGLNLDGVLRENYFYDGRWIDSFIYSILRKDFQ